MPEPPHYALLKSWVLSYYPTKGMTKSKTGPTTAKAFAARLNKLVDKPGGVSRPMITEVLNYMHSKGLLKLEAGPGKKKPPSRTTPSTQPMTSTPAPRPEPPIAGPSNPFMQHPGFGGGVPLTFPQHRMHTQVPGFAPAGPTFRPGPVFGPGAPVNGPGPVFGSGSVNEYPEPPDSGYVVDDSVDEVDFDEYETLPILADQMGLLGLEDSDAETDADESGRGMLGDGEIKHSVLFSSQLFQQEEERATTLIPQFGLFGSLRRSQLEDKRVFLNSNVPASFFLCGLQGSGKSHTLSTLLENYLIPSRELGVLRKPLAGLVLHFGEFNGRSVFRPCEAAYLGSPDTSLSTQPRVRSVTVLVSPSNYHNLHNSYSRIPGVTVKALKLRSCDLNISNMLTLMSVDSSTNPPLYMAQVTRVLREMATMGGDFDYLQFRQRLAQENLIVSQRQMLDQRLNLLESFMDLETWQGGCFDRIGSGQELTIVDLSCPFVDASAACVLFNICIGLFLSSSSPESVGKVIAVDEAHKYMTDTPAAKSLTEQLLSIIRQQRHFAARIIIATQEPTISPRLMDLASATIIHRFSSPEWFNTLRRHVAIFSTGDKEAANLFREIVSLKVGETLVFASSALIASKAQQKESVLEWENDGGTKLDDGEKFRIEKINSESFRVKVRRRITSDGGKSILSLE